MSGSPIPVCETPQVQVGPWLLAGAGDPPGLDAHRERYGDVPRVTRDELLARVEAAALRGRGGAAFPFATKVKALAQGRGRPVLVINLSEGEPASSKDSALARSAPHLVLDGAAAAARALGARHVHVVLPGDRPATRAAMDAALGERHDGRVRFVRHVAAPRFVAGQARAVLELMAGRPNLPVTSWRPEAVAGHRSRPTLLSNAETWANVGRLLHTGPPRGLGTADEPGATLLTVRRSDTVVVREVEFGHPLSEVVGCEGDEAVLLGGFHGTWATARELSSRQVSALRLREAGYSLGAGLVLVAPGCPVDWTQRLVAYLAGQSAGRCGPCRNGLPALATAVSALDEGGDPGRVVELTGLVERRGACAHPDGTSRLVRSLLAAFPDEVAAHRDGRCRAAPGRDGVRRLRRVAS